MNDPNAVPDDLPFRTFMCTICGWLYEEERGLPDDDIPPGTRWEDLPDDFVCPECGVDKDAFRELDV